VFESQLLGSFCKQIVPLFTEHDDVIETQTKNCMRSKIAHATPLTKTHLKTDSYAVFESSRFVITER